MSEVERLKNQLIEVSKLGSALALLSWDEEVYMPPKGMTARAEVKALLATELHKRVISDELMRLVDNLSSSKNYRGLTESDQVIIKETRRDIEKARKLPVEFVDRMTRLTTEAFAAWVDARNQSKFSVFQPKLEAIVAMKKEEASLLGYHDSPYDALVDSFEPDMTAARLEELLKPLASQLAKIIRQLEGSPVPELPKTVYELGAQKRLTNEVSKALGYDLKAGRIDASVHPFTLALHPTDVRITTRFDKSDFWISLGSTIHEVGHALYEQGLPPENFGTPLGESISLGIHESQSRIWENFVGRSLAFCQYLHPLLKKYFTDTNIEFKPADLHKWLNRVQPSLIRVEADEVTYNLHIIMRYELEKDLLEDRLKVAELPAAWNQKVKDYLGLDVPGDAQGVLQDIHWSHGSIGYFPTYSLGNLYAAQLYESAKAHISNLESDFQGGKFRPFLKWLRREIHQHGRRYRPEELIERVSGKPLDPSYLLKHLESKVQIHL